MRPYLLLLLIISLFNSCNSEKATDSSVLNLIPENSALLLKINDLESLENDLVENIIISQIRKEAFVEVIAHKLKPLRYVNPETSGLLTLSASNSNNFDFTFIITDSTATVALDSAKNKKVESLNYQDYSIKKYQIS